MPSAEPGNYGINEAERAARDSIIDQVAHEEGATVIDMHAALEPHPELMPDRVHPNTAGAAIMAATVAKAIVASSRVECRARRL